MEQDIQILKFKIFHEFHEMTKKCQIDQSQEYNLNQPENSLIDEPMSNTNYNHDDYLIIPYFRYKDQTGSLPVSKLTWNHSWIDNWISSNA